MQVAGVRSVSSDIRCRAWLTDINHRSIWRCSATSSIVFRVVSAVSTNGAVNDRRRRTEASRLRRLSRSSRVSCVFSVSNHDPGVGRRRRTISCGSHCDPPLSLPLLEAYSVLAAPPIHIAVERGRVTLS